MEEPKPKRKRGNPALVKGGPSLNPAGRPKGSVNALTEMQNELIQQFAGSMNKDFAAVLKAVVKKAKDGDMTAAKLLFERAIPARKAVEHYGRDEGRAGINIIIRGIDTEVKSEEPIEADFKEIDNESTSEQ